MAFVKVDTEQLNELGGRFTNYLDDGQIKLIKGRNDNKQNKSLYYSVRFASNIIEFMGWIIHQPTRYNIYFDNDENKVMIKNMKFGVMSAKLNTNYRNEIRDAKLARYLHRQFKSDDLIVSEFGYDDDNNEYIIIEAVKEKEE